MLGSVAVSEVQQILGFRSDLNTQILNALIYAQTEREKPGITFPSWLWQEDIALAPLTIGNPTLALPSGFIRDSEDVEGNLRFKDPTITNSRTVFLKKMDYKTATQHYFGVWDMDWDPNSLLVSAIQNGPPKAYALRKNSIMVFPTPNKPYVMTWSYWGADAQITLGAENLWLKNAPWVLIADAAKKIGSDLGNAQAVATASGISQTAEANLFRSVIHREEAGRSRSMGSRL